MSKAFRVITARVKGGKVYIPRTYVFLQQETFLLKGSMLTTPQVLPGQREYQQFSEPAQDLVSGGLWKENQCHY